MWGRLSTCGGLLTRLFVGPADCQPAAGYPPAPQCGKPRTNQVGRSGLRGPVGHPRGRATLAGPIAGALWAGPQVDNLPHKTRWLPLLLIAAAAGLHGEIIDRIAVSVGNRAISTSDLDRQIRVAAFLNGAKPDLSAAARRAMAERMVEQTLVRKELETGSHVDPGSGEVEPEYRAFRARLYPDPAEFARALADAGIAERDLREELSWELTLTRFVGLRFRPGVQVTAEDIRQYFDSVVGPLARAAHPDQPVELKDYRDDIEVKLTGERADREMDRWLKEARGRTTVVFHEEAFQ